MADTHVPHEDTHAKRSPTALVANVLAIAGFAILIIIVVWGLFHLASLSSGWFSNMFTTANTKHAIIVHAPESAVSGRAAKISWEHPSDGGRYAFLYECTAGLEFGIPLVKQGETTPTLARVPCGSAFTLGNATSSLLVVPILTSSSSPMTAHMNIVYVPTESGTEASGSARMSVTATTTPTPVASKPKPEAPTPEPERPTPAVPSGPADLVVTVVSATTDYAGYSVVTFTISNAGASSSGSYTFTANLPTSQPYTFHSDLQASLAPGSHIVNTLRFTNTVSGVFTAIVDPNNTVAESNETNNVASHETLRYY